MPNVPKRIVSARTGDFPNAESTGTPWRLPMIRGVPQLTETIAGSTALQLSQILCRKVNGLFRPADDLFDLRLAGHQRRRQNHRVAYGTHDEAVLETVVAAAGAHVHVAGKEPPLRFFGHQFDGGEHSVAAHFSHKRMRSEALAQS